MGGLGLYPGGFLGLASGGVAVALLLVTVLAFTVPAPSPEGRPSAPVMVAAAGAPPAPGGPSGSFAGGAWIAYSAFLNNSSLSIALTYTIDGPVIFNSNEYDENNTFQYHIAVFSDNGESRLSENQSLAPGANVSLQLAGDSRVSNATGYLNVSAIPDKPATVKVLFWMAGAVESLSYTTTTTNGTTILGNDSGPESYLFLSKDFEGANAQVSPLGAGARAEYDAVRAIAVKNALVGGFADELTNADRLSITTPAGEVPCPCAFSNVTQADAFGPGAYAFHLTGAGVGLLPLGEVVLTAADVRLP